MNLKHSLTISQHPMKRIVPSYWADYCNINAHLVTSSVSLDTSCIISDPHIFIFKKKKKIGLTKQEKGGPIWHFVLLFLWLNENSRK